jgi:hypothetical protein
MTNYKLINNITGWVVFAVAAVVYLLTIEPTASFWDCGEFITSAYKLEVGHPPGAPFFMLVGNLFTQFAGDPSQVALMVNSMSALMSAFTILFLFWTITHLTRKLLLSSGDRQLNNGQVIAVIGSAVPSVKLIVGRSQDVALDSRPVLKEIMKLIGGGGGGKPDLAQGGGGDPSKMPQALAEATAIVRAAAAAQ